MQKDPFGNLTNWGQVLETIEDLADKGNLSQYQPGLIRILRHKGNWRLREDVLKYVGEVLSPSKELVDQLLAILDDDNLYYDVRIYAGNALVQLLTKNQSGNTEDIFIKAKKITNKLLKTPHPPFFEKVINRLHLALAEPNGIEN